MRQLVRAPARLHGVVAPPGDKSISHRAVLLNSIAQGSAVVSNYSAGEDGVATLRCLKALGANVGRLSDEDAPATVSRLVVRGVGTLGFREPPSVLNAGNSGTTMRLVAGLLAAQPFFSVISGDKSLRRRPMDRIIKPLSQMGAAIMGRAGGTLAPLAIRGGGLQGIEYAPPVASAQLKSCLLIAGLFASGRTTVTEPAPSRDHTERMMRAMGADIRVDGRQVSVGQSHLSAVDVRVPGDISSAAFWLVAGVCHPDARVTVRGVGVNPSRTGVLDVLKAMGARVRVDNEREDCGEPSADLVAESSDLHATEIEGDLIPRVIDELPILALAACFAKGTTVIRDAQELRVKESDRIKATVAGLARMGADIEETADGMVIRGGARVSGAACSSFADHRIAMTMGIAGLLARGETEVAGADVSDVSYPGFWESMRRLMEGSA